MKKLFSFMLSIIILTVILASVPIRANAMSFNIDFNLYSETVYMVNTDTGAEVYDLNADIKRYPASTTKIMTYIIVAENVTDLKNTKVEIKEDLLRTLDGTGSSLSGLDEYSGKSLSVYDLLCCLMIKSGNDAALVLADFVGKGNVNAFVDMMNKKAQDLGCTATHFVNPHGLHDEMHYTTAKDMYKITAYAQELKYFMEICSTATYYLPDSDYPLVATNLLIDPGRGGEYYYTYATGIKTGTTDEAGYCLVASATYEGFSYICIAFNAPCYDSDGNWSDDNGAMRDCADMFRWAFTQLEMKTVLKEETPVASVKLEYAWNKDSLILVPEKSFSTVLPIEVDVTSIDITAKVPEKVSAPIKKGEIIGQAEITYANNKLATVNLVASQAVEKSEMMKISHSVTSVITSYWVLIPVILLVALFIVYVILASVYNKRIERVERMKK